MHTLISRIQYTLKDQNVALKDRARVTELMVAEAISGCLPIPSSPVEIPSAYYLAQHKVCVLEKLAKVNEQQVIDIDQAETLILQLWLTRYRMVHTPTDHRVNRLLRLALREGNASIPKVYSQVACDYPGTEVKEYHTQDEKDLG